MRVLVLGITGMLGSSVFRCLSEDDGCEVFGTLRNPAAKRYYAVSLHERIIDNVNVLEHDELARVLIQYRPDVVINCVGLIKQHGEAKDPLVALPINSLFPHRLANLCSLSGARVIHISTDCVFSGKAGGYLETDQSDAEDLYGKSKFIGELTSYENAVTLRTSIIGHELNSAYSLVDWFLGQTGAVKGYRKAIFSGLPTIELARVICNFVLPRRELRGLYHVSAQPISKFDLLTLIAAVYGVDTSILPSDDVVIDRSLNSEKFKAATGYKPSDWPSLIELMKYKR